MLVWQRDPEDGWARLLAHSPDDPDPRLIVFAGIARGILRLRAAL